MSTISVEESEEIEESVVKAEETEEPVAESIEELRVKSEDIEEPVVKGEETEVPMVESEEVKETVAKTEETEESIIESEGIDEPVAMNEGHINLKRPEKTPVTAKRSYNKSKKDKDKPTRPLSAYNYFFREERLRIMKIFREETENPLGSKNYVGPEALREVVNNDGKAIFNQIGKLIGKHWKNITDEEKEHYNELAAKDSLRYKREMKDYDKMRDSKKPQEVKNAANEGRDIEEEPSFSNWASSPTSDGYRAQGYHSESNVAAPMPRYPQPHYGGPYGYYYAGMSNSATEQTYGPPEGTNAYYGGSVNNFNAYYGGSGAPPPNDAYGGNYSHHGEAPNSRAQSMQQWPSSDQSRNDSPYGPGGSSYHMYGDRGGSSSYYQQPYEDYHQHNHHQQQQQHNQQQQPYEEQTFYKEQPQPLKEQSY